MSLAEIKSYLWKRILLKNNQGLIAAELAGVLSLIELEEQKIKERIKDLKQKGLAENSHRISELHGVIGK